MKRETSKDQRADKMAGFAIIGTDKDGPKALTTSIFGSCKEIVVRTVSLNGNRDFTAWNWVRRPRLLCYALSPSETVRRIGTKSGMTDCQRSGLSRASRLPLRARCFQEDRMHTVLVR